MDFITVTIDTLELIRSGSSTEVVGIFKSTAVIASRAFAQVHRESDINFRSSHLITHGNAWC